MGRRLRATTARRALVALAALPALAAAQPRDPARPPLLAFHGAGPPGPAVRAARDALTRAAEQRGTALVDLSPPAPLPPEAPRHLARAIEAYHQIAYPEALAAAEAGLLEAAASGARGLTPSQLGDLYLYRALAATELGDGARAWEDFVAAATVNPVRTLDPVRFAPRVIETFQRALAEVARLPRVAATVAAPVGCARWLDGRPLGEAAISAPRGEHIVRLECAGKEPWGAGLALTADGQVIRPALVDLAAPDAARLAALANERGFGEAILAETRGPAGGPVLALTRIDGRGRIVARVSAALPAASAGAAAVAALERLLGAGAVTRAPPPPARPWYRSPAVWIGALTGAAVATALLLPLAVSDGEPATGFDVDLGPLP